MNCIMQLSARWISCTKIEKSTVQTTKTTNFSSKQLWVSVYFSRLFYMNTETGSFIPRRTNHIRIKRLLYKPSKLSISLKLQANQPTVINKHIIFIFRLHFGRVSPKRGFLYTFPIMYWLLKCRKIKITNIWTGEYISKIIWTRFSDSLKGSYTSHSYQ